MILREELVANNGSRVTAEIPVEFEISSSAGGRILYQRGGRAGQQSFLGGT